MEDEPANRRRLNPRRFSFQDNAPILSNFHDRPKSFGDDQMKFIRLPDVLARTGLKRANLYLLMQRGGFPEPVKISSRSNGWVESEVEAWIEARIAERNRAKEAA